MTAATRATRKRAADALCGRAFTAAACPGTGVALVAVGGYGRAELAPYSDLDLLLVHGPGVEPGEWAARLWYPLWDSGHAVDHAVRSLEEVVEQAGADLRVALGLLDVRHVAGDPDLSLRLRSAVLTQWRRDARSRLGELQQLGAGRVRRSGELAHAAVPDLKDSAGGLRDATVLKGLAAAWLVDVPHTELERCRVALLDVRDLVHQAAGRATDRVTPELWEALAADLALSDALAAQRYVRGLGRRLAHLSALTWRRAQAALRRPPVTGVRRPRLERVAPGVAVHEEEVVLDVRARPGSDPLLLLRCAAQAAERGLVLSPHTAARLARESPPLPEPWSPEARDLLVRLLAAGPGLLPVWSTLEETGAVARLLPEWEQVRLLPHATTVHRFTVDRHLVETCVEAAPLVRRVARPDLLVVAALLHDIGKALPGDHSEAGAPVARAVACRLGFSDGDVALVGDLVRHHLLLPRLATTRDLADPATVEAVTARVRDPEALGLLATLTEADARATGEQAWTRWRSGLVSELVSRAAAALTAEQPGVAAGRADEPACPVPIPEEARRNPDRPWVGVEERAEGSEVVVVARDRVGLLGDVATVLAARGTPVRSARAWTVDGFGVSAWQVAGTVGVPAVLRQRLEAVTAGAHRAGTAVAESGRDGPEPLVSLRPGASRRSTVLEVRTDDRPGVVATVCAALAGLGVQVVSAHVDTIGPQAVDVFYLRETGGAPLDEARGAAVVRGVRTALHGAATLEGRS
ncbi:MAG TPA: [protein-PII] uridylyltransferase [Marmoricola sp.]|nr:[protein-PII] uridylyltransferase [Marmoricola sp.]